MTANAALRNQYLWVSMGLANHEIWCPTKFTCMIKLPKLQSQKSKS